MMCAHHHRRRGEPGNDVTLPRAHRLLDTSSSAVGKGAIALRPVATRVRRGAASWRRMSTGSSEDHVARRSTAGAE